MINTPIIIPSLRNWAGSGNYLTLPDTCRLVIYSPGAEELAETAKALQEDFCSATQPPLVVVSGVEPVAGDILLILDKGLQENIGEQGYILEIEEHVTVRAKSATGIFYGGQTLLQMLRHDPTHTRLPRGRAFDHPAFLQRGIMLDAGRRYWGMDYLFQLIRQMARLKLNVLHLHLSDWSGFRLQSDRHPGLATEPAYSKAEIAALQAYARQWHVCILPEIDLPAHATPLTRYQPSLAFTSEVMSKPRWPGGELGGFTLDFTDPEVRKWVRDLLDEFIPWFDGPSFHIGCDEVAAPEQPEQCPNLADYARRKGYPHTTDVLVEWINEMNTFLKTHGKRMQIWNWWERTPHSLNPEKDITIDVWVEAANPGAFLDAGYRVVNTPEDLLYLTPGINLFPNCSRLFQEWQPNLHPNMLGYKICVWADNSETKPDGFFEALLRQPRAILAERTWNPGIPSMSLDDFLRQLDVVSSER